MCLCNWVASLKQVPYWSDFLIQEETLGVTQNKVDYTVQQSQPIRCSGPPQLRLISAQLLLNFQRSLVLQPTVTQLLLRNSLLITCWHLRTLTHTHTKQLYSIYLGQWQWFDWLNSWSKEKQLPTIPISINLFIHFSCKKFKHLLVLASWMCRFDASLCWLD